VVPLAVTVVPLEVVVVPLAVVLEPLGLTVVPEAVTVVPEVENKLGAAAAGAGATGLDETEGAVCPRPLRPENF
jgi:hypothetical protein